MSLINLSKGTCKSCYRCVNSCGVKAIKMVNEQAEIVEDRCINCGHCVVVCPQEARRIENDVKYVKEEIKAGRKVAASIAPSFAGAFEMEQYGQLVGALKTLGFTIVEETAVGAEIVAKLYSNDFKKGEFKNFITTSCPSTNNLIEKYYPSLIKYMAPVVSPMIAHGRMLKKTYGDYCYTVFIGPCISKKAEAVDGRNKGAIDAVITFGELREWINEVGIDLNNVESREFDRLATKRGCEFPLLGGVVNGISNSINGEFELIKADGVEECMELFKSMEKGELKGICVEANVCKGGCIGGPSMSKCKDGFYERQKKVKDYIKGKQAKLDSVEIDIPSEIDFSQQFDSKLVKRKKASENEILNIMRQMGKYKPKDELNCGGCGYNTCREKAQAVYEGMSEASNCLPYIRSKAESLKNVIFEYSPNIILIIDSSMRIIEVNPTGEEVLNIKAERVKGMALSKIMDDTDFVKVKESKQSVVGKKAFLYNKDTVLIENIMYLEKEDILLAIMTNISEQENNRRELMRVKEKTLNGAQEVIEKQMRVAQEIASLLGETTAETKVILTKLMHISMEEKGDM